MLTCWMRGRFTVSSRYHRGKDVAVTQITARTHAPVATAVPLHSFAELARVDVDVDLAQLADRGHQVAGVAAERLLALLGAGAQLVADHARLGKLVVVHRE